MYSLRSLLLASALSGAALGLVGCGVGPGPDLAGPRGPELMEAYSGDWVLLRLASDDLDSKYREAMAGRPGPQPGMRPGGGGGGMRPGGGFPRGGGGMAGGLGGGMAPGGAAMDPTEMRRIFEATGRIAHTPTELGLGLRPDAASFRPEGSGSLTLSLDGKESEIHDGDFAYFAAAQWTDEGLVVERKVDGGGKVKDRLRVDDEGKLVVEREIDALRGGTVKGTLVYTRKER